MPLLVYASLDLLAADAAIRAKERSFVDLSTSPSQSLAEQANTVRTHQTSMTTIYLGFLDPLYMLTPHHETLLRKVIDACRVLVVTSDPGALSLFWKNGLSELHLLCGGQGDTDADSWRPEVVDNGGSLLPSDASGHGRLGAGDADQ